MISPLEMHQCADIDMHAQVNILVIFICMYCGSAFFMMYHGSSYAYLEVFIVRNSLQ